MTREPIVARFCSDCPPLEGLLPDFEIATVGRVRELQPGVDLTGTGGFFHEKPAIAYDPDNAEIEPAVLTTIAPTLCAFREGDPYTDAMECLQSKVEKCKGPITKSYLFGLIRVEKCGAGIVKLSKFNNLDQRIVITSNEWQNRRVRRKKNRE